VSGPIRVLFHLDSLAVGGLERKVTQLALRLDRKRFEPMVSWSWKWGVYGEELQSAGIPVVQIVPAAARCVGVGKATQQIRELAADIFHTFSCRQNASDVLVAHRANVPVIISARDNVRHWAPKGPPRNWEFYRNSMTDFVTPCCEAAAVLCQKLEGVHPTKVVMIHNGVEPPGVSEGPSLRETIALPAGTFLIGYAAAYRALKGHESLFRAMRKIADRRPDVHLVCCGADPDDRKGRLEETVGRLKLEKHVTLMGPQLDMEAFYRSLDVYVHPSTSEGLSMAILESMSHELPVVATAVGGTAEIVVDGNTGLLTPPSDPGALCEAILNLMDQPEVRSRMGTAGRERVSEHFSTKGMVQAYEALYLRAMKQPAIEESVPEAAAPPTISLVSATAGAPTLADTTIFVTTIGDDANFSDCLAHLRAQTVRCQINVIDRVAPMSAAFACMHERCSTPYYVQVDEDMLLHPKAIETLHELIEQSSPDVALLCAPLWDCDVERPILGVKIYRHDIVKQFPYRNTLSCEVKQLNEILAAGYKTVLHSTDEDAVCLGEHGKHYTPETVFLRWQRLFHKHNHMGHLSWLEPWPARLLERYTASRDPVHLYAALGAIAGIAGRADGDRELDWRDTNAAWQRLQYYFPECPKSNS
jgi:glycosyltransferase involved in cell wall biosynthesis